MLERRDTSEPMRVRTCPADRRAMSSRGDYSRAASISFRACSGAATIRERRLFERGVYSVIYGTCNSMKLTSVPIIAYNSNVHFARNDPFSHLRSHLILHLILPFA